MFTSTYTHLSQYIKNLSDKEYRNSLVKSARENALILLKMVQDTYAKIQALILDFLYDLKLDKLLNSLKEKFGNLRNNLQQILKKFKTFTSEQMSALLSFVASNYMFLLDKLNQKVQFCVIRPLKLITNLSENLSDTENMSDMSLAIYTALNTLLNVLKPMYNAAVYIAIPCAAILSGKKEREVLGYDESCLL